MEAEFQAVTRECAADGATVFLSSHLLDEVEDVCDRVAILREGNLVEVATLSELRQLSTTIFEAELARPVPSFADLPEVLAVEPMDGGVRLTVVGGPAEVVARLSGAGIRRLHSRAPSLEQIFLTYYDTRATQREAVAAAHGRLDGHEGRPARRRAPVTETVGRSARAPAVPAPPSSPAACRARPRHTRRPRRHSLRAVVRLYARLTWRTSAVIGVVMAGYVALEVASYRSAYPQGVSPLQFAIFEDNPAVRMMNGVPRALDTAGGFTVWDGGWMMQIIIAVWAVLTTSRLLRGEEDLDRTDLVLATPVRATRRHRGRRDGPCRGVGAGRCRRRRDDGPDRSGLDRIAPVRHRARRAWAPPSPRAPPSSASWWRSDAGSPG